VPLPASIPTSIQDIAKTALSPDPAVRFQTALDMHHAIAKAMAEANLVAESADVAAFVVKHVGDRLTKQRKAIDFALSAAAKRAAVNELLCATDPQSSPTLSSSATGSHTPSVRSTVTGTVAGTATDLAPLSRRGDAPAMPSTPELPRRPRALFASLVASGTLALIGVLLAIAAMTVSRHRASNAAAARAAATQIAESPPSGGAMPAEPPLQALADPPVAEPVPLTTAQAEPSPATLATSAQAPPPKPVGGRAVTPVAAHVAPAPRPKPASSATSRDFGY
jgi:hypothetical protein